MSEYQIEKAQESESEVESLSKGIGERYRRSFSGSQGIKIIVPSQSVRESVHRGTKSRLGGRDKRVGVRDSKI